MPGQCFLSSLDPLFLPCRRNGVSPSFYRELFSDDRGIDSVSVSCAHRAGLKCEFQVCVGLEVVCMGVDLQEDLQLPKGFCHVTTEN